MTDTFRAMCAELIDALDSGIPAGRIRMSLLADRARALLAQPVADGPPTVTFSNLLNPAYEITGEEIAEGAQLVDGEWWNPLFGCDSLQIVVDNARAVLARWGRPKPPDRSFINGVT